MKESVTSFDFEAAFKALDEIEAPVSEKGIKANRPALTEIFSKKSKFDSLFEEYYDINSTEGLNDAKEAQEAEIAKAKLARIEKIVDLDAKSPEDLLATYVGKYIIQCPQCMTLFYKDKEDVVASEEDPTNVNVGEACQHCGNDSGYTLVGKVGEADEEETPAEETPIEEPAVEETPVDDVEDEATEEATAEESEDDLGDLADLDLDLDLDEEPAEEEKKEESFIAHTGDTLVEDVDADLDAQLKAHNEYIEYLKVMIKQEEEAMEECDNEFVKKSIERRLNDYKADLEAALPEAVKNAVESELPTPEDAGMEDAVENTAEDESAEKQEESLVVEGETLIESLLEGADLDVSDDEFKELISSPEFKKPISDVAVRAMLNSEKDEKTEETNESLEEGIFDKIKDKFANIKDKVVKFIDDQIKTRSSGADFILKNALKDYTKVALKDDGSVDTAEDNRKFKTFVVTYFTNKFNDGADITSVPTTSDINKLVKGKDSEAREKYADAENLAKGWSKIADNGPAIIFMANSATDDNAEFLCMYFKGSLDEKSDQLAKQIENVKNGLAGAKAMEKGKHGQADTKQVKASELKQGMQINTKKKGVGEIVEIAEGDTLDFKVTLKLADGTTVTPEFAASQMIDVLTLPAATESLATVMSESEDLNESTLETLISSSLVESYGNVAGFKLTECAYTDNKFTVDGTIYFTSGNTRKTTYVFNEAYVENNTVKMTGLNEKLGLDKQFTLTGKLENKTLIAESFICRK